MMDTQASARDDTFIASMVAQRWILSAISVEILLAVYLYTYQTSWGPALEPLRSLTGGPVQYVPVVASFFALIADVGGYALWLLSFGEFVIWVSSTADVVVRLKLDSGDAAGRNTSRMAIAAAVIGALAARPLRIFDVLVLFGNLYVLAIRGDTGEKKRTRMLLGSPAFSRASRSDLPRPRPEPFVPSAPTFRSTSHRPSCRHFSRVRK